MADAMIGFGIGLSGTPKDYTSIVAARQRQKQLGELEEKKKKQAMNEDILKSISVPSGLVMDYRTKEMEQATANFVREAQDAIEKQDINTLAQLKQQYKMLWDQRVAERKMFDEDLKNYEAGSSLMGQDPRLLRQAKSIDEAQKLAEQYPDDFFVTDYGIISAKPVKNINLQSFYTKAADDLRTTEPVQAKVMINGKPATIMTRPIDKVQFEARMRTDFRGNKGIQDNVRINFINNGGDLKGLSNVDKAKKLEDYYVQQGASYLSRDPSNVYRDGKGGLSFSFNMGGDKPAINQPLGGDIQITTKRGTVNVPVYASSATGDIKASLPVSSDAFYTGGNRKIPGGKVTTAKYNQVSVVLVAKNDIKIPSDLPFLENYNIPQGVKDYAGQTIQANQIIDPVLKDYLAERGYVRAAVVTFGIDENTDKGFYRTASLPQQNQFFEEGNKQKSADIINLYNKQREVEASLTQMYNPETSKSPNAPAARSASTGQPKSAAPQTKKKENKYGI
jgi:hypothetical protein